jgi:hypothetical protein
MTNLLNHLRPESLARLIAELIADHADEDDTGEFTFRTESAKNAYADLLAAGTRTCGEDEFFTLVDIAIDAELSKKEI